MTNITEAAVSEYRRATGEDVDKITRLTGYDKETVFSIFASRPVIEHDGTVFILTTFNATTVILDIAAVGIDLCKSFKLLCEDLSENHVRKIISLVLVGDFQTECMLNELGFSAEGVMKDSLMVGEKLRSQTIFGRPLTGGKGNTLVKRDLSNDIEFRKTVQDFEKEILLLDGSIDGDSELCPLRHTFTDGAYAREIFIPAGMIIVGKIHKHEHLNFLLRGRVTMSTEDGLQEIVGPCMMVSAAGTKRVLYTHEDTVWTTIHVTDKKTPEDAEHEIIAKTYSAIGRDCSIKELAGGKQ